jgi:two-component system sensor histidine kinase PilS (NtrC family)
LSLRDPFRFVAAVRTLLLVSVFASALIFQISLGPFASPDQWFPLYGTLFLSFLLNSICYWKIDAVKDRKDLNLFIFCFDIVVISFVSYLIGLHQSVYLLIFLLNLFLANLLFVREEAWVLVLLTSVCFNGLMIFTPSIKGEELVLSLLVNNGAFVLVNFLSGQVAGQLKLAGSRLEETHSDLVSLQNFNDLIVNSIKTGVMVITRTGFVQFFNPEAREILNGLLENQKKVAEIFPNVDWESSFKESLGGKLLRHEVQIDVEGEMKIIELKLADFRDESERSKGWLLLLEDRTEVKGLEHSLRQKEKLAAVGQLAAGIAHEIRNPLASISGSIQMMSAAAETNDDNKKLMRIVLREIDRLNDLISEFLTYVRPEDQVNDPVDVNQVIRECLDMIKVDPKLRADVKQEADLQAASMILGRRDKLKQVFLNFFVNALQAMAETKNPVLEVVTRDERDQVVIVIRDSGSGIKKENLDRIFEPFHTTKPSGTGLGLAITHKILEAHKARISVESEVGKGTRFLIEIPSIRGNFLEFNPERKRA